MGHKVSCPDNRAPTCYLWSCSCEPQTCGICRRFPHFGIPRTFHGLMFRTIGSVRFHFIELTSLAHALPTNAADSDLAIDYSPIWQWMNDNAWILAGLALFCGMAWITWGGWKVRKRDREYERVWGEEGDARRGILGSPPSASCRDCTYGSQRIGEHGFISQGTNVSFRV